MKCNKKQQQLSVLSLFILISSLTLSCTKDSDALFEVSEQEEVPFIEEEVNDKDENAYSIVNDTLAIFSEEIKVLNIIENDSLFNGTNIRVTNITTPEYGDVVIKDNNTIEYTAPDTFTKSTDVLNYTVELTKEDGEVFTGEGKVVVSIEGKNYLLTVEAKNQLRERFNNGYVVGSGFSDDISKVKDFVTRFLSNPGEFRPWFGDPEGSPTRGQYLHTSAVYAYVMEDTNLANAVAKEILETVNANSLDTPFWNNSSTVRWDAKFSLWVQTSKIKKTLDSYHFVKYLQTTLSESELSSIETWFNKFSDLAYAALKPRFEFYLGDNWDTAGESKFIHNAPFPTGALSTATPIQDAQGNDVTEYTMSWAQDIYNNRQWEYVAYIHSVAVKNNDLEREHWARQFVKSFIKYGIFSDGTMAELFRNKDEDPTRGVFYSYVSLGAIIQIAHLDAMAGHYPSDKLYDYKTVEGVESGSTTLTNEGYAAGSTTDGITEKSLLTALKGQSNYLRSSANGGWNDLRFFRKSDNSIEPLSTVGKRQPSAIPAIANLYYKNNDLKDFYTYNTAVGYPPKKVINEGYLAGFWEANEDMGSWGNLIFGAMWYEQEQNFFN
ncbi:Ig-like domain-containing protein [Hyunsoonleella sp. 2307UL5-6]|uniref:Ig-like domain-containing protein n=1 Tax=Hyunsoonleella sp. 2307UL5-6 TaxID=3384768 RepID=UPI0039BD902F